MHTEEDEVPVASKKKLDKGQTPSDANASPDKADSKKPGKSDGEDPKPRIVLTFRSDKKNCNMKIVPNDEKHEEFSPRRSSRTRNNRWEWSEEAERELTMSKKDKNSSQSVSETDETSDSSHTTPKRSTRRRSKDSSENVLANAIARKEKSYNEPTPGPTRLSRRIKPTAKILANEELRIGLESQNNARLGIQLDKSEEVLPPRTTRNSARAMQSEIEHAPEVTPKKESRASKACEEEEALELEGSSPEKKQSPNTVMKLKHLCELGLKAINPEALEDDEDEVGENEEEEEFGEEYDEEDENDEVDDDSEVISKLLEADEDTSDEDFSCTVNSSTSKRPRRSARKSSGPFSSYGVRDNDSPMPVEEEQKEYRPSRKRSRPARTEEAEPEVTEKDDGSRENLPRRAKNLGWDQPAQRRDSEPEEEDKGEPADGEEGAEAACPDDDSAIVATCYCETPSNVHAAPSELVEPVFCGAVEVVDGVRVGCSHAAAREGAAGAEGGAGGALAPLRRAGPRAPFLLLCDTHTQQMHKHMCCPACGLFCTQGIFYQCSLGHLFHLECGLPYGGGGGGGGVGGGAGCPHCGVRARRWAAANRRVARVRLRQLLTNKRILLPDQREQCTPAYLTFTPTAPSAHDESPVIPEDLLPSPAIDLKRLLQAPEAADYEELLSSTPAQRLCDAILAGETLEQLLPKIAASRGSVDELVPSLGMCASHVAATRGRADALHALACAGADLDVRDANGRSPLLCALTALLEKSEHKSPTKSKSINESKESIESKEEEQNNDDEKSESGAKEQSETAKVEDEQLMKAVRYLLCAGCDVNLQGPEGMTGLHVAAQHGSGAASRALLDSAAVDVDARDLGGWTPLVWAAENGHAEVVRLLLSHGASAWSVDAEGNSVLHWCALAGRAHALRLLLDAAPHAARLPNAHRDTPLHVAARHGHYSCVIILLARGARTDVENSAGQLPVEVCAGACQSAISLNMQMSIAVSDDLKRHRLLASDISNGAEEYPVPCVNEVDDAPAPADFTYVTDHVLPEPLDIDCTIQSLQGCSCAEGACGGGGCACSVLSVRRWTAAGRLLPAFPHHDPPMLFECNATCACNKRKCTNMLITRLQKKGSIFVRAEVYRTLRSGWGLRAAAGVPRGSPVALYCGELLPLAAADARPNDQYLFALDVKPDLMEQCGDKPVLCVDACRWGGAARFVNHSCRANLAPVRVFAPLRDLRLPRVALFATRDIQPGEQFTFDYGDKFWSVKARWMKCECGEPECRYPEKITDEDK